MAFIFSITGVPNVSAYAAEAQVVNPCFLLSLNCYHINGQMTWEGTPANGPVFDKV